MIREVLNLCNEEEKMLAYLEENRRVQHAMKSIIKLLGKDAMIPTDSEQDLRNFKSR
jgi:hypothetical protein